MGQMVAPVIIMYPKASVLYSIKTRRLMTEAGIQLWLESLVAARSPATTTTTTTPPILEQNPTRHAHAPSPWRARPPRRGARRVTGRAAGGPAVSG
jgi:hypothetical protein